MADFTFYLGTHETHWLGFSDFPLFVSRRRLARVKTGRTKGPSSWPVAKQTWCLDSGGFTELSLYGRWTVSAEHYARECQTWAERIGRLRWAAPQDYMCEPFILDKTGLTVQEHQARTIQSVVDLRRLAPEVHFIPVLQGFKLAEYVDHVRQYERAGFDLTREAVVGVGSVCRRQGTDEAQEIFQTLSSHGIRLHGFGLKTQGLLKSRPFLVSSDSLAWSLDARRTTPLASCKHRNCANCYQYAVRWRGRLLAKLAQLGLG